jgi:predicted metal-dependent hydrolase
MAQKVIQIDDVGEVLLQKRRGNRSIRLTIGHDGITRVTMPNWTPYHVAEAFARSKVSWIQKQRITKQHHVFEPDEWVGKDHRLTFIHENRKDVTTRVGKSDVIIRLGFDKEPESPDVQTHVHKAAIRALKQEAKRALPPRLEELADRYGFNYSSVSIKQLKSRWGSCSSRQEIALNCYLMQLPWELIDYVLLHELVHTRIMAHGEPFWTELAKYVPNLPEKRKQMRSYQPMLVAQA